MNGSLLIITGIVFFVAAYIVYGRYLSRLFGINDELPTPANDMADGVDYVASKPTVLFGHHFASIAGAGPIVGPILACYFGWAAVALWILFGCVFIGAFHDFGALFLSVRHRGRSIAHVIEHYIGYTGRQLFLIFCWAALVLVAAIFVKFTAKAFVANGGVAT